MTEYHKIVLVLFQIKTLVSEGKCSLAEKREKNIQTLAELGLLPKDVFQILFELTPQNYYRGPSNDYDTKEIDCIWEFGTFIEDKEIYIKLKLTDDYVKNISFHIAERKIEYLFKDV